MAKLILSNLANLNNANTVIATLNTNNQATENAMENTLSLDGTSPNAMESVIDMNSFRIINVGGPVSSQDAVRLIDLQNVNADAADLATAIGEAELAAANAAASETNAAASDADAATQASNAANSATAAAASASSAAASLVTLQDSGIWNNTNTTSISANYGIQTSDKGKTIQATGDTCYTVTFAAAAGYQSDFICFVQNTSTTRAKIVNLDGVSYFLWPLQGGFVYNSSNVWYNTFPGRWVKAIDINTADDAGVIFYVDSAVGNDDNDGLATGSGNALATIQEGVDRVYRYLDTGHLVSTVQLADGVHSVGSGVLIKYAIPYTQLLIQGNPTTPTNCVIYCSPGGSCFSIQEPATVTLSGMFLNTTGAGSVGISARQFATVDLDALVFGNFPGGIHINFTNHTSSGVISPLRVAGSATIFLDVSDQSFYSDTAYGATVDAGLTFTDFIICSGSSIVTLGGAYTGAGASSATTGTQYNVTTNGILNTNGTVIPGNVAGSSATQGQVF